MKKKIKLFRDEVLEISSKRHLGDVLLVYPTSNYLIIIIVICVLACMATFMALGTYTRHESVSGVIEPTQGLIRTFSTQPGVVKNIFVKEGDLIKKGKILAVFTSEHPTAQGKNVETELEQKLQYRLDNLHRELTSSLQVHVEDSLIAKKNMAALIAMKKTVVSEIETQKIRIKLSEDMVARYQNLEKLKYIAQAQLQEKQDDLLDQQMRLQELEKTFATTNSDIEKSQYDFAVIPAKQSITKEQLERSISSIESELSKQQSDHEWLLIAPVDGIVSALSATTNQTLTTGMAILTIIPNTELQAKLYASSRSIGFLKIGQLVKIKVEAFPYQKFGFLIGKISEITGTPVNQADALREIRVPSGLTDSEPLYEIRATINSQTVSAYNQLLPLRAGMQLDANIELDTRALYEWVFEPIYTLQTH